MTETSTIDRSTPKTARPRSKGRKSGLLPKPATVSSSAMAAHLDLSRQYIERLADIDGVLHREPDGGFLLDQNRVAYLRFLRRERKQSAKSGADAEFTVAKTRLMQLRIAEREKLLMNTDEALFWVETLVGLFRSRLHSLPARIGGRDLPERRRIEAICNEILQEIADEANRKAAEMERELGIEGDDAA